jgi:hypothetical protein
LKNLAVAIFMDNDVRRSPGSTYVTSVYDNVRKEKA